MEHRGTLAVVATPIGNLEDLSPRAARLIREADVLLAEDTRVSAKLLAHTGCSRAIQPYHDHNKERVTPRLIEQLRTGVNVALLSDAGTPGVADPAFYLVREARRNGIAVTVVPGPCAAIAALVGSGLPTDRFVFESFLPPKSARRRRVLESLRDEPRTVVIYESPHRICSTLADMVEVVPHADTVVARELTKLHEEFLRGTPAQLLEHFTAHAPRGELVLLFNTRVSSGDKPRSTD